MGVVFCAATSPGLADEYYIQTVSLPVNDIVYDPGTRLIYASIPSTGGPGLGNTITRIDPVLAQVVGSVFVGSEPRRVTRCDDGSCLYVGLNGAAAVRRYDIATQQAGLQFSLGSGSFGPWYAEDIEVVPGSPGSIAVSLMKPGFSPRHEGVAIYDDGVRRPTMTPGHTGSNVIEFGRSPADLYGHNNETTEFGLRTMWVHAGGVTVVSTVSNVIGSFGADLEYEHGVLYATTGRAIRASTMTLLGTYNTGFGGPVAVQSELELVYIVERNSGLLRVFDRDTFVQLDSKSLGCGNARRLVVWDTAGLAVACDSGVQIIKVGPLFAGGFE